ncbi:MAG: nucleotidyltransferase [Candidatus Edwardsbacteria bacterium]
MLEDEYKRIIAFLNKEGLNYLVIGGVAVSVIGEPRETIDIDLCVFIKRAQINSFLRKAKKIGYTVNEKEVLTRVKLTGTFSIISIMDKKIRIDFIIASHAVEKNAFKRKIEVELYGVKAYYPTPEDLILLKIVPGRTQDIADVEKIAIRHKSKLDEKYLLAWAMKLSDESQDLRIYKEVKRLLSL